MTEDLSKTARLLVSDKVRNLLARHGISDSQQQLANLMTLMNASHSQVYRKLSGRSSWLEEDLLGIATHYGETLASLFSDTTSAPAGSDGAPCEVWHEATVEIDGRRVACRVTLAESADSANDHTAGMVLLDTPEGWHVAWANGEAASHGKGPVRKLEIDRSASEQGGFAVFDDHPDVAEAIVDNLLLRGVHAQAFFTTHDLLACRRRFDVYIIDWFSSDTSTAGDLIAHLRTSHAPDATIVVLTGQIQREHTESDLARLIHTHGVLVELKPMRVDLLLAKVKHLRHP